MREEAAHTGTRQAEACLGAMNFVQNWDEWRGSLSEMVQAARDIDPSEAHVVEVVEDMIDFLSERMCPGSPEERMMRELWDTADEGERKVLARTILRLLD
jgi:sulfur relay (sulfurtransferase) DsrC/TusE family protein